VAVKLANGDEVGETSDTGIDQTDYNDVASFIFDPIVVTADNVADTVIADGFYTADDICTGDYVKACQEAGIS
jgi:D-xylose transport system substrate-binding protein